MLLCWCFAKTNFNVIFHALGVRSAPHFSARLEVSNGDKSAIQEPEETIAVVGCDI